MKEINHPGIELESLIEINNYSQRELAATLNVAHSFLNNVLKGNRNINLNLAISLEAAGLGKANDWLDMQVKYLLYQAKSNAGIQKQNEYIKIWKKLDDLIPLDFIKRQDELQIQSSEDVDKVLDLFGVKKFEDLNTNIEKYRPIFFRKSSKFSENKAHVYTWSKVAEYKLALKQVPNFDESQKEKLLDELNFCFLKNRDTIGTTNEILNSYGVKFIIQDRPSKTPVDGKSFISGNNPAIALTLKYKRLDNFAYTLMHELGHVFLHLFPMLKKRNREYKEFYVNNNKNSREEIEADLFAQESLIPQDLWDDFITFNHSFNDSVIYEFANENNIHPAIVRGRVCFEFPEYYRRRTSINKLNILDAS